MTLSPLLIVVAILNELVSVNCTTLTVHDILETCFSSPSPTSARTRTLFVPTSMYFVTSIFCVLPAGIVCSKEDDVAPRTMVTVTFAEFPVDSPVVVSIWSYE